jgi:hypothetical protein
VVIAVVEPLCQGGYVSSRYVLVLAPARPAPIHEVGSSVSRVSQIESRGERYFRISSTTVGSHRAYIAK